MTSLLLSLTILASAPNAFVRASDPVVAVLTDEAHGLPESSVKGARMLELADLYWSRGAHLRVDEIHERNRLFDAWKAAGGKGTEPQLDLAEPSRDAFARASMVYDFLLQKYPDLDGIDGAFFHRAMIDAVDGRPDDEAKHLQTLLDRFPASAYADDTAREIATLRASKGRR